MNTVRNIQALNKRELENLVPPSASWHTDYRDTAYLFIGGFSYDLSEGDIVTIFSQFGEPTWIKLQRDKETGKSKGFAWLRYEDQRSTDLAVDNLGGAIVLGRTLRVDHTRYKQKEGQEEEDEKGNVEFESQAVARTPSPEEDKRDRRQRKETSRPMSNQERELQELLREHDEEDPMRQYLINEKRKEIAEAEEQEQRQRSDGRHHRRHRDHSRDRRDRDRKERGRHGRDRSKDREVRDDREHRHRRRK